MTDLDTGLVQGRLSHRLVGRRIVYRELLGSTMDEARTLAEGGEPEGTVVVAEEQTRARGRFDRAWVSPPGDSLSLSLLLRPTTAQLHYVNMAATLAVAKAVGDVTGLDAAIKWPNDVRVGGRKISGILVETAMDGAEVTYAVVGVGLNVNLDPSSYPEIAAIATSMLMETGRRTDRTTVLRLLLQHLDDLYGEVRAGHSLTDRWSERLETLGRRVEVRWRDRVVKGLARTVDEHGNLLLTRPDGSTFTAVAGEVTLQI